MPLPTNAQNYITVNQNVLILDSCLADLTLPQPRRALQLNVGGIPQIILTTQNPISGNGQGVVGVNNDGELFWTNGATPGSFMAGGDLAGVSNFQTVIGLRNTPISPQVPLEGQVLQYKGTTWYPTYGPVDYVTTYLFMGS